METDSHLNNQMFWRYIKVPVSAYLATAIIICPLYKSEYKT